MRFSAKKDSHVLPVSFALSFLNIRNSATGSDNCYSAFVIDNPRLWCCKSSSVVSVILEVNKGK